MNHSHAFARRRFGSVAAALLLASTAQAQAPAAAPDAYPSKMLRLVVPYTAGGTGDIVGRLMGHKLAEVLGQQVLIDNKPGAGGNIGAENTVRSAPDGYTAVITSTSLASNPSLQKKMSFDPLKDLVAVSQCCGVPMVLVVNPALPIRSVAELIAYAKANPGKLNFSSSGIGTSSHLAAELFKVSAGVDLTHVPYKADAQALPDLLAGNVSLMFMFQTTALPQVKAGKLRALAVSTATRSPLMPDLPTVAEAGVPGFDVNAWSGVIAPAGLPRPILDKLNGAVNASVQDREMQERLAFLGTEPGGGTPEQFAELIRRDSARWAEVIRRSGAKIE
jgi:tripartite-type tricarboxylate transporter receptor subunit TctC